MPPDCFSEIISRKTKNPMKENIIALGIALKLNLEEMEDLLSSAGYAFTNSESDIICRFWFEINSCTIDELNQVLVDYGCQPVGRRD